jgi:hypothetical protein
MHDLFWLFAEGNDLDLERGVLLERVDRQLDPLISRCLDTDKRFPVADMMGKAFAEIAENDRTEEPTFQLLSDPHRFNAVPVASGMRAHRRRVLRARNAGLLVNVQVIKSSRKWITLV